MVRQLRVGVVADWSNRSRGEFWNPILKNGLGRPCTYVSCRISDTLPPAADLTAPSLLKDLREIDVLVVNWDAANGDPEFGGDLTCRWLEHHRREIWLWVSRGGLLLIEGQAVLGVPDQRAYDALLGKGEVRVCGAVDDLNPTAQLDRCGSEATVAARAREQGAFCAGLQKLQTVTTLAYEQMFPHARVDPLLEVNTWSVLYRGWFLPRRRGSERKFSWHVIATTPGRRRHRHPVLLAARHGMGSIFVSTMLLASSGQKELVSAIIGCVGHNASVPQSTPLARPAIERLTLPMLTAVVAYVVTGVFHVGALGRLVATAAALVVGYSLVTVLPPRLFARWRRYRARKR